MVGALAAFGASTSIVEIAALAKLSKCYFGNMEIDYLGHIISAKGVARSSN